MAHVVCFIRYADLLRFADIIGYPGPGAVVAAATSALPFLMVVSEYKSWVFAFSGGMLVLSGWLVFRSAVLCSVDPQLGKLCQHTRVWNRRIYWISLVIWIIGFIAAYIALPLQVWFDL